MIKKELLNKLGEAIEICEGRYSCYGCGACDDACPYVDVCLDGGVDDINSIKAAIKDFFEEAENSGCC